MTAPVTAILQTSQVSPPPDAGHLSYPLSFMDILWLPFFPVRRLLFYTCHGGPCSTRSHFLDTVVPNLEQSLSLALRHYLPVAGNVLCPPADDEDDRIPFIRYVPGDSVTLTVAESFRDLDDLVGNHSRDADQFYDFVPQMPPPAEEGDYKVVPLMAIQVTLFPNRGICIGFANHHSLGDGSSVVRFIRAWAEITRLGGDDEEYLKMIHRSGNESLPVYDRSLIRRSPDIESQFWKIIRNFPPVASWSSFPLPTNRVRATYTLRPSHIKGLKDLVMIHNPELVHVSSFVVTTAYAWTCLLKSGDAAGDDVPEDDDVLEDFVFTVDIRGRLEPPMPASYFGNCLSYGIVKKEHKTLVGEEGFLTAAAGVAEDIQEGVKKKGELLSRAEKVVYDLDGFLGARLLGVSGSPRFDLLAADFGWGRARKMEVVSIDGEKYSMSLCKSGAEEGGLEVGLSLPLKRMEAFAAIFDQGLLRF